MGFMNTIERFLDGQDRQSVESRAFYKEWDKARANAMSPSERAEIDAIFSRQSDSF